MTAAAGSRGDRERAQVLDALRGFALLGILLTHLPEFSGWEFRDAAQRAASDPSGIDRALAFASDFLIRGKFFSLFALLFGIGFAIQLDAAARQGADFRRRFLRRLAVLFAVGVAHGLLWYGDILRDYAVLGLLLLPTAAAALWLGARLLWPFAVLGVASCLTPSGPMAASAEPEDWFVAGTRAFAAGSWREVFAANLALLELKALQLVYEGKALSIAGMFLLGAALGKLRLHADLARAEPLLRRALAWSLPLGLLGNLALVLLHRATPSFPPSWPWVLEGVVFAVAVPSLALAYASGFALLFAGRSQAWLRRLAPAGRAALSTYVTQTVVCVGLFYGVGLGWSGALGNAASMALAVPIFAAQTALAAAWLERFRFGPLEWCWRRLTYGTPVPMRRRSARPPSGAGRAP